MKVQFGAGLEYQVSDRISFTLNGEYNFTFSDKIDNEINGRRDDFYVNGKFGIHYHFGSKRKNSNQELLINQ